MKYILLLMSILLYSELLNSQTPDVLLVKEHKLSNGMTVWLNEDHSQPKVFGAVVVKAGSKDSPNTGIPHYFEHIMFKGTDKIGTVDYEAEKVFLDSIAQKYDELTFAATKQERDLIQQEINLLSVKAADYVIPNEFDRLIAKYGGSKLNAGTAYDYTVYYNTFSPQFIAQWATINSERLISPVFRMFQSELETVYEEKNMHGDYIGGQAIERLTERYFYPHPYAYPIIGSTENLKNPRLSEMYKFFKDYYVASNMGLILSGDFDMETILPLLEKTFSRIPIGKAPHKTVPPPPPFKGKEKTKVKFPIPIIKASAFGFRGVPANHPDQAALTIAVGILNNTNGTGYFDKLTVDRKVMAAMSVNEGMNDAGLLGVFVVPKLVVQSYRKAEKLIWDEIERVKNGDFSEEIFNSLKLEQLRQHMSGLEDISSRSQVMIRLFSQGKSWNDYLAELDSISLLTKEDVVNVANKYFGANYLYAKKKTGKYPKDNLPKPGFAPITPKHAGASSAFARELDKLPVKELSPRFIDLKKDAQVTQMSDFVTLYSVKNPVNDIFTLSLNFQVGQIETPTLKQLVSYLPFIGTEKYTFNELRTKLQTLGSTMMFDVNDNEFLVKINGFDRNFDETLDVVSHFFHFAKEDDDRVMMLADDAKVTEKAFFKSSNEVASALFEYVKFQKESSYLRKLSLKELKKMKGKDLVQLFDEVRKKACDLHYCGSLSSELVSEKINKYFKIENVTEPSSYPCRRVAKVYEKPKVFFYHMPDVSQSIVYCYMQGKALPSLHDRHLSKLFSNYFGIDRTSLLFQEIREYRSYAYFTYGGCKLPSLKSADDPISLVCVLSTQNDKTHDAISVLDELIKDLPERPDKINSIKYSIVNQINNNYPNLRDISAKIASYLHEGYDLDPNKELYSVVDKMSIDDVMGFYDKYLRGGTPVYIVVGNKHRMDMKELAKYGEIVNVSQKTFYR